MCVSVRRRRLRQVGACARSTCMLFFGTAECVQIEACALLHTSTCVQLYLGQDKGLRARPVAPTLPAKQNKTACAPDQPHPHSQEKEKRRLRQVALHENNTQGRNPI